MAFFTPEQQAKIDAPTTDRVGGVSVNPNVPSYGGAAYNPTAATAALSQVAPQQPATPQTPQPAQPQPNQPIDTSQPNPATTKIAPPNAPVSYTQANQNLLQGGLKGTYLADAQQSLKQKYGMALSTAKESGSEAPQNPGEGSAAVQQNLPPPAAAPYDSAKADTVLADNQAHQQYLQDYAQSQSSQAQTESLTQIYSELSNTLGIPALNTELMNMKNIIDGTEQDIRDEVTKAGGFATNSQVLAMTDARNKTMIQNYNNLLQTKDDAEKNLSTMMDLSEKDRAYAQQKISDQLNFDQQNIQYADKALANAQDAYATMQKTEGWDGIYKAALATGDPQAIQKINSTMGPGFDLATMAAQDAQARAQDLAKSNLDLAKEGLDIANTKSEISSRAATDAREAAAQAETVRHNLATEAEAANKPPNDILAPGQADISKVMSAIEKTDKATQSTIDMTKLRTDPAYFYWVKGQLGQ